MSVNKITKLSISGLAFQ